MTNLHTHLKKKLDEYFRTFAERFNENQEPLFEDIKSHITTTFNETLDIILAELEGRKKKPEPFGCEICPACMRNEVCEDVKIVGSFNLAITQLQEYIKASKIK